MLYDNCCPMCNQKFETKKAKCVAEQHLTEGIIRIYRERQLIEHLPCPMCGKDSMNTNVLRNALSRTANIQICDECGMREAIYAFECKTQPLLSWWLCSEMLGQS